MQKASFIGALGRGMQKISKYNIIVEKQVLPVPDFRKALVALIAAHYNFKIQYPNEVTHIYLFIEKYLIGVSTGSLVTPAALHTITAIDKLLV